MKKNSFIIISFLIVVLASCKKFVSKDDFSPNYPNSGTLATLLPTTELSLFATYNGNMARVASIWTQQKSGVLQQYQTYAEYIITESDVTNDWQTLNITGVVNANNIISLGKSTGSPHYVGIGEILKAMLMGIATDFWGDIPAKDLGSGSEKPVFEPQVAVIGEIQDLLSDAIIQLQTPTDQNVFLPGSDDFIHGGDNKKWIITAWILKARYANRLSKKDPSGSAQSAILFLKNAYDAGLNSSGTDANAKYSSLGNELNPWYSFDQSRTGYIVMAATLVDTMTALNDPRLAAYAYNPSGGFIGGDTLGDNNTSGNAAYVGNYFKGLDTDGNQVGANSLPLVTYVEAKFIEAESQLRSGNEAAAQDAYYTALKAHLSLFESFFRSATYNDSASSYLQQYGQLSGDKFGMIMVQKWISSFTQAEAYSDWRRTRRPVLKPYPDVTIGDIPQRWPTEVGERLYNPNAIVVDDITQPVWWAE